MPIFMRLPMRVQRYHHWIRGVGGGCTRRRSKLLWSDSRLARPVRGGRAGTPGAPLRCLLVFAWLLRRQIAGLSDSIQIQSAGRKLRDLPAATRWEFHVENLGSDHPPNCAFVHGEEVAAHPVPALEIVRVVDADHNLQLGLSPEAGAVRSRQSDSRIEVRQLELAVTAKQNDSGLVVRVFTKIIIRPKLKAHIVRARHLVGGVELQPFSAGANTVRFALIRRHEAILGASQCCRANQSEKKHGSRRQPGTDYFTK